MSVIFRGRLTVQSEIGDGDPEFAGQTTRVPGRGPAAPVLPRSNRPFGDAESQGDGREREGARSDLGALQTQLANSIRAHQGQSSAATVGFELTTSGGPCSVTVDFDLSPYVDLGGSVDES